MMVKVGVYMRELELEMKIAESLSLAKCGIMSVMMHNNKGEDVDFVVSDCKAYVENYGNKGILIKLPIRIKELVSILSDKSIEITGEMLVLPMRQEDKTNIISIISAQGGSGSTSISIGLAKELRRYRGKRACYVSLEAIISNEFDFQNGKNDRFFYYINKNDYKAPLPKESFLSDIFGTEGVIAGAGLNEFFYLNKDEFLRTINVLKQSGFDYIIFDIGNAINLNIIELLDLSDIVIVIEKGTDNEKHSKLIEYIESKFENIKRRMVVVENFSEMEIIYDNDGEKNKDEYIGDEGKSKLVKIDHDEESLREGISIDGAFGIGVKEIADLLYI